MMNLCLIDCYLNRGVMCLIWEGAEPPASLVVNNLHTVFHVISGFRWLDNLEATKVLRRGPPPRAAARRLRASPPH